jgi:hypothetical protein
MKMKRLINKIFKIEPQLRYIIPEYLPSDINLLKEGSKITKSDLDEPNVLNENKIEEVLQSLK